MKRASAKELAGRESSADHPSPSANDSAAGLQAYVSTFLARIDGGKRFMGNVRTNRCAQTGDQGPGRQNRDREERERVCVSESLYEQCSCVCRCKPVASCMAVRGGTQE